VTILDSAEEGARPVTRRTRAISVQANLQYADVLLAVLTYDPDPLGHAIAILSEERWFWVCELERLAPTITVRADRRIARRISQCDKALRILRDAVGPDNENGAV
jgi:hypothetical protein